MSNYLSKAFYDYIHEYELKIFFHGKIHSFCPFGASQLFGG